MLSWFNYWGHMCLLFELLGLSVFDFLVTLYKEHLDITMNDIFRKKIITIPTLWIRFVTSSISSVTVSSFYMNAGEDREN